LSQFRATRFGESLRTKGGFSPRSRTIFPPVPRECPPVEGHRPRLRTSPRLLAGRSEPGLYWRMIGRPLHLTLVTLVVLVSGLAIALLARQWPARTSRPPGRTSRDSPWSPIRPSASLRSP